MKDYNIVLADDHQLFRSGMKRLIEDEAGLFVAGQANDGLELMELLARIETDMAIVDLSMPNLQGLEAARKIKKLYPHIKLMALTMHRNKDYLSHALEVGFDGYLLKDDSDVELIEAIATIRSGKQFITEQLKGDSANAIGLLKNRKHAILSRREIEVLKALATGGSNRTISQKLNISIRTVENHRANITKKLELRNVADLVRYALQNGLIQIASVPNFNDE